VFIAVGTQWPAFALLLLFTHATWQHFVHEHWLILTTNNQDLTQWGAVVAMPATTTALWLAQLV